MYNYISLAQNNGIDISNKMYSSTIKKYTLNKENNLVRVEYMDGTVETVIKEEKTLEQLKQQKNTVIFSCCVLQWI